MPSTRSFTPSRLGARSALILFVPVVVILFGMTWYYYDYHIRQVDRTLTSHVGRAIAVYLDRAGAGAADAAFETAFETLHEIDVESATRCRSPRDGDPEGNSYGVRANIEEFLPAPFLYRVDAGAGEVRICVERAPGEALVFTALRKRMVVINSHIFIVWVVLIGALLTLVAWGFLRNQVRSIVRLSEAAKAFGRGRDIPDFRPSGASEIREAARAVIDMKRRLTAFAEQRTAMLAGVSHDLRTPLTRLKLQAAMLPPSDDRDAVRQDIADMEAMIEEYLSFARGEDSEPFAQMRLDKLLSEICESNADPRLVADALPPVEIIARRIALKRAISNLVQNALQHAGCVRISLTDGPRWAEVLIDDDGPGIDPDDRDEALKPFSRLDPARTQNQSGSGLGLAIAHDAARTHGGELRLETSPLGGLRARLRLPQ